MKKFWSIFVITVGSGLVAMGMPGEGSPEDPFQISTVEDLQLMAADLNAHYILVNDIDASATATWNPVAGSPGVYRGFEPIGDIGWTVRFRGSLDGQGFLIQNLYVNRPDEARNGLFGYIEAGATVQNLGLSDVTVIGGQRTGGLAGENHGLIQRVFTTGYVQGAWATGGLVGENNMSGIIENTYSHASLSISNYGGGLVGANRGTIQYSLSSGAVIGPTWAQGGLVGQMSGQGEVQHSFWDIESSGVNASAAGTGKTTSEMLELVTFSSLDIADVENANGHTWVIDSGNAYPTFGWNITPEQIDTINVLSWPEATEITFGDPLLASSLIGGQASVAGAFTFEDPSLVPTTTGSYAATILFTPSDSSAGDSIAETVDVEVQPRVLTVSGTFSVADKVQDGRQDAAIINDSLTLNNLLPGSDVQLQPRAVFSAIGLGTHVVTLSSQSSLTGPDAAFYILSLENAPTTTGAIEALEIRGRPAPAQAQSSPDTSSQHARLEWHGSACHQDPPSMYEVLRTTSLSDPDWESVALLERIDGLHTWISPDPVQGSVYYRVRIAPPPNG